MRHPLLTLPLLACALLASCIDDESVFDMPSPNAVWCTASVDAGDSLATRTDKAVPVERANDDCTMADEFGCFYVLRSPEAAGDSLCIYANTTTRLADTAGAPATRATAVTSATLPAFRMWGWYHDRLQAGDTTSPFESFVIMKPNNARTAWGTQNDTFRLYWPTSGRALDFLAVAAANSSGTMISGLATAPGFNSSQHVPTITYTVPSDNASQHDLLAAYAPSRTQGSDGMVPLTFRHLLTGVRFTSFGLKGTVTQIQLTGIRNSATFTPDANGASFTCTPGTTTTSYTLSLQKVMTDELIEDVTDESQTFFLIPQSFSGTTPKITITISNYNDTGTTRTFTLQLAEEPSWRPGVMVTYSLLPHTETYKLLWSYDEFTISQLDPSMYNTLLSYRLVREGNSTRSEKVDYTLSIPTSSTYTDLNTGATGTTSDTWFTYNTRDVNHDTEFNFYNAPPTSGPAAKQEVDIAYSDGLGSPNLRTATSNGQAQSNPSWLQASYLTGTSHSGTATANSYIVSRPGWYKIVCVYGNAIKEGIPSVPSPMYNANGNTPTSAFIDADLGSGTYTAELLWCDISSTAIQSVECAGTQAIYGNGGVKGTAKCIRFYVNPDHFQPGNAVIALRRNGTIVWSWHIWITDTPGTQTYNGYRFMDRPLGYAAPRYASWYNALQTTITATQAISGRTATFTLKRNSYKYASLPTRYCCYQWGRKDPFPIGIIAGGNSQKPTLYNASGTVALSATAATTYLSDHVKNPMTLYFAERQGNASQYLPHSYFPTTTRYLNLWNSQQTALITSTASHPFAKTAYDPSPQCDYHVPCTYNFLNMPITTALARHDNGTPAGYISTWYAIANGNLKLVNGFFYGNGLYVYSNSNNLYFWSCEYWRAKLESNNLYVEEPCMMGTSPNNSSTVYNNFWKISDYTTLSDANAYALPIVPCY